MAEFSDYTLPTDGYVAFDATSLKNLIIQRLNDTNVFSDQKYEGSNLNSIIDIVAYSYHVLLFYLNRTASESNFSTAEIYDNVNKIVKILNYSPIGYQTPILSFEATATASLQPGTYTIPRYSYFTINGVNYTFNKDVTFSKTGTGIERLTDLEEGTLLYQGIWSEYPSYFATGEPFETLTLTVVDSNGKNIEMDHFNINVYVKDNSVVNPVWEQWSSSQSLFLEKSNSKKYEIRMNENERYEIKFGNNVTGKQLNTNDEVAIYYLRTNGTKGEVGPGLLNNCKLFFYSTSRFDSIESNVIPTGFNLINNTNNTFLLFTNSNPSTQYVLRESVQNIKNNSINTFKSQYRLITTQDFKTYVDKNYGNIICSSKVVNNWDYTTGHLKYYFDLGVDKPNLDSRVLFNQVKFADACNFNNIYIYAVPRLNKLTSLTTRVNYLNAAQKQLILNDVLDIKITTAEPIINDPVYVGLDFAVAVPNITLSPDIANNATLEISRNITAKRNPEELKIQIYTIFKNYFSTTADNLGKLISFTDITNEILALEGVENIKTKTVYNGNTYYVPGVSMVIYNPVYPYDDIRIISQDTQLPYYKFPYINNVIDFVNKIVVITPSIQSIVREF